MMDRLRRDEPVVYQLQIQLNDTPERPHVWNPQLVCTIIIIIIIIKGIYIAHVCEGHKCAMSAVWLRNCLCLCSYLHS